MDTQSLQKKKGNYLIQYWLTVILFVRKFPVLCLEINHFFLSETKGTDKYIVGAECKVSDAKLASTQSIHIISLTVTNMYSTCIMVDRNCTKMHTCQSSNIWE
jgi:hypothetical protein